MKESFLLLQGRPFQAWIIPTTCHGLLGTATFEFLVFFFLFINLYTLGKETKTEYYFWLIKLIFDLVNFLNGCFDF